MNHLKRIAGAGFALLAALCVLTITACWNPSGNDDVDVTGVSLNKDTLSLYEGATETLSAVIAPANATNKTVRWASSDTTKATVNANGIVNGVAAGTATITATTVDGGYKATCAVTVTSPAAADSWTASMKGVNVPFRYVPAGSFQRDATAANVSIITNGYWMGETEVTQELFEAVMGTNPSHFNGTAGGNPARDTPGGETQNKRPVENVNCYHVIAFCNKLSIAAGKEPVYSVSGVNWTTLTYDDIPPIGANDATWNAATWNAATWDKSKNGYRLPTEMEWMWAAMGASLGGGTVSTTGYNKAFAGSDGSNSIEDYAWYTTNSGSKTHEVGKKTANELGLKDMSGNVWEWCWDWYASYPSGEKTNYDGAVSGTERVLRDSGYFNNLSDCKMSSRDNIYTHTLPSNGGNGLGFRVVCP